MRKRARRNRRIRIAALLFFVLFCAFAFLCDTYIRPIVSAAAADSACSKVNIAVNRAVCEILEEGSEKYKGITKTVYDDNNNVRTVETEATKLNLLKSEIEAHIAEKTSKTAGGEVKISLGTLIGNDWLNGRGIKIAFEFDTENMSVGEFHNSLTSAGINQTKYSLTLRITTDVTLMIPWHSEHVSVITDVVIAEQVIVGEIPDSYTNIYIDGQ